ncbi:MAG: hypothetical protein M3331_00145 [Actinomycetota bacterium]|nr:hypothetical protein [Actinomycetota bacterium]
MIGKRVRYATCATAIAGALAAGATPALASEAERIGDDLFVTDVPNNEFNDVRVFYESSRQEVNIVDAQGITAGFGCMNVTATRVSCSDSPVLGRINVLLGDNPDQFLAEGGQFALPLGLSLNVSGEGGSDTITGSRSGDTLNGGSGNDLIRGKGGNDVLGGSSDVGRDRFIAGAGSDKIRAQDGQRDADIDCGAGDDRRAQTDSVDPQPRSC